MFGIDIFLLSAIVLFIFTSNILILCHCSTFPWRWNKESRKGRTGKVRGRNEGKGGRRRKITEKENKEAQWNVKEGKKGGSGKGGRDS